MTHIEKPKTNGLHLSFGAWNDKDKSTEKIHKEIKSNRKFIEKNLIFT